MKTISKRIGIFLKIMIVVVGLSEDNVCSLIVLVLKNNYFKFNDIDYRQKMGTAMGSSIAPAYASLFIGKFEMHFKKSYSEKQTLW